MVYGHGETCGLCHSKSCKHQPFSNLSNLIAEAEKAPREITVKVSIPAETKHISHEIDQDTITWFALLDRVTQEAVSELNTQIDIKVREKLQFECGKLGNHGFGSKHLECAGSSPILMRCKKCQRRFYPSFIGNKNNC